MWRLVYRQAYSIGQIILDSKVRERVVVIVRMRIAFGAQFRLAGCRALSRFDSCFAAAPAQYECDTCDGMFYTGLLRPELFGARSGESGKLLPGSGRSR